VAPEGAAKMLSDAVAMTFGNAEITLSGIELANKIKKGQFDTSEISGLLAMTLQVWEAALAA
jgi:hypothetical protein